ncbi:unnamed protein product [Symbiodinium sp. CCMP2592]|nr:unnamed protein product [Symbiodinium sp. CCMP2592]
MAMSNMVIVTWSMLIALSMCVWSGKSEEVCESEEVTFLSTHHRSLEDWGPIRRNSHSTYPSILDGELVPSAALCANFALGGVCAADNMSVTLGIDHTWLADLIIWIENPAGNVSRLLEGNGGARDLISTSPVTFESSAGAPASDIGLSFLNAVRPFDDGLDALATSPNGNWSFCIGDRWGGDIGTFVSFSLNLPAAGPSSNTISGAAMSSTPEVIKVHFEFQAPTGPPKVPDPADVEKKKESAGQ